MLTYTNNLFRVLLPHYLIIRITCNKATESKFTLPLHIMLIPPKNIFLIIKLYFKFDTTNKNLS